MPGGLNSRVSTYNLPPPANTRPIRIWVQVSRSSGSSAVCKRIIMIQAKQTIKTRTSRAIFHPRLAADGGNNFGLETVEFPMEITGFLKSVLPTILTKGVNVNHFIDKYPV